MQKESGWGEYCLHNTPDELYTQGIMTLHVLTNMAYWQSSEWMQATDSIYDLSALEEPEYFSPYKEAWLLFRRRKDYDVIHSMGIVESMFYGLLCLLTGRSSKQIMTEIFIDEEQPERLSWHFKTAIYTKIAQRSLGVITNSQAEIPALAKRFNLPENRFCYVPLNSTVEPVEKPLPGEGFILAAGRSLRDYPTLIEAATDIDAPIIIIGGSDDLRHTELPANVTFLREVDRETYLDYVRRCSIMVLPLQKTVRPTGQVVLLEAMSFGKPVIASEQVGTVDYIKHDKNGMLIPLSDAKPLAAAANTLLRDKKKAHDMGLSALETIKTSHTNAVHTTSRLAAIDSLVFASDHHSS